MDLRAAVLRIEVSVPRKTAQPFNQFIQSPLIGICESDRALWAYSTMLQGKQPTNAANEVLC